MHCCRNCVHRRHSYADDLAVTTGILLYLEINFSHSIRVDIQVQGWSRQKTRSISAHNLQMQRVWDKCGA